MIDNDLAIKTLLCSRNRAEATEKLGVHKNFYTRKFKNQEFRREYEKARKELVTDTTTRLLSLNQKAIDTLSTLLSPEHRERIQLDAAKAILSVSSDYLTVTELQEKIERLEDVIQTR